MSEAARRAQIIGTGLVGGSVGLALRAAGWHVTGTDLDPARADRARERGAVDEIGTDGLADLVLIAVPVGAVSGLATQALALHPTAAMTDVGSVKAPIVAAVDDPRFVGGHPMAGSEQEGIDGSRADMFRGAVWVLTPTTNTDAESYALVHSAISELGAEVVTLAPSNHDAVVAMVSHVPHLTAATLMGLAARKSEDQAVLLRLAAGGFRDMTRISAGHPGIWPDICAENREAIVEVLDDLVAELSVVRGIVSGGDRVGLLDRLDEARQARLHLPGPAVRPDGLVELLVPMDDRPGQLAAVTTAATDSGVNIYDIEIAHSTEGARGTLIVLVDSDLAEGLADVLRSDGYQVTPRSLE